MGCEHVRLPGGHAAIVCSPTRRCKCGRRATLECDWKVATRRSGTCDAPICAACARSPAPNKDLCPKHQIVFRQWKAARAAASAETPAALPQAAGVPSAASAQRHLPLPEIADV